jgi:hypothetical protein
LIEVAPLANVVAAELKPPPDSVTEPVGVGVPPTAIATVSVCAVVMLEADGTTVTVGVVLATAVTVTKFDPEALL